jgi:DNA-directed RNA polymerase specialized sigma24 family protein
MREDDGDRDERSGPTPEPFEAFYLREYPQVVGLLHGLLGSRLVAEELAQETFLIAYRDWDRISGLDNPRAWVRKVAINQRGSFLRAFLRQQTRERDAVARDEEDSSVAQVDAASRLREIVQRTSQPVAYGHTAVLHDAPQESPRPLASSCLRPRRPAQPQQGPAPLHPPAAGPTGRPGAHSIASPPAGMGSVGCSDPSGATGG